MTTLGKKAIVAVIAAASMLTWSAGNADAFWGHRRPVTTAYAVPAVPVVAAYAPAPVVVARPVVVAGDAPAATAYYAPATTAY